MEETATEKEGGKEKEKRKACCTWFPEEQPSETATSGKARRATFKMREKRGSCPHSAGKKKTDQRRKEGSA